MSTRHPNANVFPVLLLMAGAICAQTFRGGIAGSVSDSSGAAIPTAMVTIVNEATAFTRSQTTTSAGDFTFPDLPLGSYSVTIAAKGFQTQKTEHLEVAVGKVTNLAVSLNVATQSEVVEVQATPVSIETSTSALNAVVNTRAVQEIPLNGRDFRQLLYLTPGFNQSSSMNGNRPNQNNWQIDGVDNNDFWHNAEAVNQGSISGVAGVLLPIDAIDQFNQQAGGGAEFGRNPGSMVNVVIKSGANDLHGSAYYFNRNEYFAERSPFAGPSDSNKLRNQNWGFSLGGPILKNKTFYFLTYEHQKFIAGNPLQATVPSDAWFARARQVLAKYNVAENPVILNVYNTLWPAAIRSAPAAGPNFFSNDLNDYKSDNGIIRVDHVFNEKQNIFFRAFLGTGDATAFAGSVYHDYFQSVPSRQHNFSLVYNSVLTPRLVNQVLAGVNYFHQAFDDAAHGANLPALGFNTGVTNPSQFGAPNMEISGFDNGGVGETPRLGRTDTTGHLTENLSYNAGRHALKFGGEFRRALLDVFYYREARGGFGFDGTAGPWAKDAAFTDTQKALADFLAGYIGPGQGSIATGDPQRDFWVSSFEWWAQDNFQVTPNLNFNYGVRYAYNGRMHVDDNSISIFLPTAPGGLAAVGKDIDALYPKDLNNFAPRVGFAYTPKRGGRLVIRGGYGVYYDIVNGNLFIDNRAGSDAGRGISRNPGGPRPVFGVSNPDLVIVKNGQFIFGSATPQPPFAVYTVNQNMRSPYVQNYNLNVQYQVANNTLLQVGYVGNEARKLVYTRNINQAAPGSGSLQSRRPFNAQFPQFRGITEIANGANSNYNGLQASLRTTSFHRLTGQFSYTWSHALDMMSGPRNNRPTNNYNLRGDYGNADFDIRHNFTAYMLYDVPGLGRALPRLTSGWQLNGLITYDSGTPFSMGAGRDVSGTNNRADRVDVVGDPFAGVVQPAQAGGNLANGVRWFNKAAFAFPAPGTFGSIGRNTLRGPDFKALDFSIFKNTPITERVKAQLRVEIFNLFNTVNLSNPIASLSSGSAGLIFGTRHGGDSPGIGFGEPRNVQFALKLIF